MSRLTLYECVVNLVIVLVSLSILRAFFAFLFTERLFTTILEPGTGQYEHTNRTQEICCPPIRHNNTKHFFVPNQEPAFA